MSRPDLNYDPQSLKREKAQYFIPATDNEIEQMCQLTGHQRMEDLFAHIPSEVQFKDFKAHAPLEYNDLAEHIWALSQKNQSRISFIGDGLKDFKVPAIVSYVLGLRNLTTAYTPYQPERGQGTLNSLWIYASALSQLTGFEAINASLYERSTCLYEAFMTAVRIKKSGTKLLVSKGLYPGDLEVLYTMCLGTDFSIITVPLNSQTGLTDQAELKKLFEKNRDDIAALAFPQVNCLGHLESVDDLTDFGWECALQTIAIIDPLLLGPEGLKAPSKFGSQAQGSHMIVGEGQHLCLPPNFGGPGLGIFGIRYNENNKTSIRMTPGRYIGKAQDKDGRDCKVIVLSTREQHIRREKATSNICSNQSFVATIAGAALLQQGDEGLRKAVTQARQMAVKAVSELCQFEGVELAYPSTPFFNEVTLRLKGDSRHWIEDASRAGLHIGVDVSDRTGNKGDLLISFFDHHTADDIEKLMQFFASKCAKSHRIVAIPESPQSLLRKEAPGLKSYTYKELVNYYHQLNKQNVSPDDAVYPLGSCTMKYNPYLNDWAAGLIGFAKTHPQAPVCDVQGNLELLYSIQEMFKNITGLAAVTTQPVAGAQGELVGLKMFQAYHRHNGEEEQRTVILIPKSAHGTNPATASMTGFKTYKENGVQHGIVLIDAADSGEIDFEKLRSCVEEYQHRIAGIMITNPNTCGIFETRFKEIADLIHSVGGLVYMDGANMNAIAGIVDLGAMGVDAVHNNLHKTWSIPHGGGGPGDAIVAVSEKLLDFLPGNQIEKHGNSFIPVKPKHSIGSVHRHYGNFAHKVRAYTYLKALGDKGIVKMSQVAVLSANYLYQLLKDTYVTLPKNSQDTPRLHEFILSLSESVFQKISESGTPKSQTIASIGKIFLDFGLHAPTVAFPEPFGLMIEPTESFTKVELDRFAEVVKGIHRVLAENPELLQTAPHFTPISRVNELEANKKLTFCEVLKQLPPIYENRVDPASLAQLDIDSIIDKIKQSHQEKVNSQ